MCKDLNKGKSVRVSSLYVHAGPVVVCRSTIGIVSQERNRYRYDPPPKAT